ncbi:LysR family transcriptional regulator [Ensifer adhaerens]|uniref:LysR family transcriptional regulator n=1 Tax=Ensifer adhaerens TaxID=106592 RepID=UPI003D06A659
MVAISNRTTHLRIRQVKPQAIEDVRLGLPRDLDLVLLRAFVAVAESGQITKAARRLNLTQSAVSQQIGRLEQQIGMILFERLANRIRLTPEGRLFYGSTVKLIALNDEILREVRRSVEETEIRLGVPHDLVERYIPNILRCFAQQYPNVRVKLVSLASGKLRELLELGQVDLTLTTELVGEDSDGRIVTDRLVWVGARDARAYRTQPLMVALGDDGDMFRAPVSEALNDAGIVWRPVTQVGSLGTVLAMLAADMATAPFLSETVPRFLEVIPDGALPQLPYMHINLLRGRSTSAPEIAALESAIRDAFVRGGNVAV